MATPQDELAELVIKILADASGVETALEKTEKGVKKTSDTINKIGSESKAFEKTKVNIQQIEKETHKLTGSITEFTEKSKVGFQNLSLAYQRQIQQSRQSTAEEKKWSDANALKWRTAIAKMREAKAAQDTLGVSAQKTGEKMNWMTKRFLGIERLVSAIAMIAGPTAALFTLATYLRTAIQETMAAAKEQEKYTGVVNEHVKALEGYDKLLQEKKFDTGQLLIESGVLESWKKLQLSMADVLNKAIEITSEMAGISRQGKINDLLSDIEEYKTVTSGESTPGNIRRNIFGGWLTRSNEEVKKELAQKLTAAGVFVDDLKREEERLRSGLLPGETVIPTTTPIRGVDKKDIEDRKKREWQEFLNTKEIVDKRLEINKQLETAADDRVKKFIARNKEENDLIEYGKKNEIDFAKTVEDMENTREELEERNYRKRLERIEEEKKKREELAASINMGVSGMFEIANNLHQIRMNEIDAEQQREIERVNKLVIGEKSKAIAIENINKKADAKRRQESEKGKQIAKIQAIISGAVGIMKLYQTFPWPIALALTPVMAALTATQVGVIESQKFEDGGRIGGNLHKHGGTIIEAERDEYIMSRRATSRYGFGAMEAINQGRVDPGILAPYAHMRALSPMGYFETGGRVTTQQKTQEKQQVNIVNFVDPQLFDQYLNSTNGKRSIKNLIADNRYDFRKAIGIV